MTEARHDQLVLYEVTPGGVGLVTLNRPDSLNALSPELIDELGAVLAVAEDDAAAGCVVLTGAGRGFSSGGDVGNLAARAHPASPEGADGRAAFDDLVAAQDRLRRSHARTALKIYEFEKPIIAYVNGPCAGGAVGLACACDLRVASDRAVFTTAYARIGRSGDAAGTFFLRQLIGPSRARELYFTAERVSADRALELGLVDRVYPHEESRERALELASRIAAGPSLAFAAMKRAFRAADAGDLRAVIEMESASMPLSGATSEGERFLSAFLRERSRRG